MSERNVELSRRWFEAYNARDIDAMLAFFDPSIEFHSTFSVVSGGVYYGHDGMRMWHRDQEDAWERDVRAEPEAYFHLGEHTLVFYVLHGRGRHSGVAVAMPNAAVFKWSEDLIVFAQGYVHREDAVRDLGVSQDDLEPIDP
jgi:ketosteroid isomerase-like protein